MKKLFILHPAGKERFCAFAAASHTKKTTNNLLKAFVLVFTVICTCCIPASSVLAQCTTGCNQSVSTNTMPGTNNFSNTFCITTGSSLTYNKNFDMNGGTVCIGPNVTFSASGGNYNGNWTINNYGTFTRNLSLNSGQTFNNYGTFTGSLTLNGGTVVNYNGASLTPSSFTFNGGSFTNNSGGTATFSSSISVNSGATFVNNGILNIAGNLTLNSSASATLNGTTTISGAVTNNGNLTTGGSLTISGNYTQNSSGTSTLNGTISIGGAVTNNGNLTTGGSLTVSGNYTQNSSGSSTLNGTTVINGNVTNNGPITVGGAVTVTGNYYQNSSGSIKGFLGGQCNSLNVNGTIQGNGTYNGSNGLVINKALTPSCTSCLTNGATVTGTPTNQINGPSLSSSGTAISGTITNPGGSPAATHYIVLRRFGSDVTDQPTNYTSYSVGDVIGSSTVVAVNSISTLTFTDAAVISLYGCGTYYYAFFPQNSNGTCGTFNRTINTANKSSITISGTAGTAGPNASVCTSSASGTLTLTGYSGSVVRWEYAVSPFSSWTTISNTTNTYSYSSITRTTKFRAVVNAGTGCGNINSAAATISVAPVAPPSGTGATRCGPGTLTLTATPAAGETVDWYSGSTGGTALLSGNTSYSTGVLSSSATYYAAARNTTTGCVSASRTAVNAIITQPAISSFSPQNAGPGMQVIITGVNFTGTTAVKFGGVNATSFTINSSTQITAVVAGGSSGNVSVTTSCGTASRAGFTFYPAPTLTSFTPASGYIGNVITITGTNFTGATSVTFGGTSAASFTVVSSTTITAVLGTGATGAVAVTTPGGTATKNGFTYIPATVWTGALNDDWNNAANWNNGIPASNSLGIIPQVAVYPVLSASQAIRSLLMDSTTLLTITGSSTLGISNDLINNGKITGQGNISMSGSSSQTISGTGTVSNIIIDNTAGVSISSGNNRMSVTGTLTPTAGVLTTNGNLTLKSTASGSAMVAQGSSAGNYISGTVSWERYIPGRRAWRFITYPFTSAGAPTINETVQEGAGGNASLNPRPGYGTHITGGTIANGFDANPSGNPSMKEPSASGWVGISTTNQPVTNKPAYFIFVRGSRANNLAQGVNAPVDNTTLAGTGNIKQGDQSISIGGSGWQLVANPFPAPVSLDALATANSSIVNNNFTFWDPKLGGSNNVGGFVTASYNGSGYDYAPQPVSSISELAQPGAAFFVDAKSAGSFSITEASKSSGGSDNVFRPAASGSKLYINLRSVNSDNTQPVVDGAMVAYKENFSNAIDELDAKKLRSSMTENISVKKEETLFSVERRSDITTDDTVYLSLNYMKVKNYQLELDAVSFDTTVLSATLEDTETGIRLPVDLSGNTLYNFAVTANSTGSRLRIVLKRNNLVVLPVTFTGITATQKGKQILVSWTVKDETNIAGYEIEKSSDGKNFTKTASVAAVNNLSTAYNWTDEAPLNGMNFYRIKINEQNGQFKYSSVAYTAMNKQGTIVVYPNPVTGNTMQLLMKGQEKGNYKMNIYNNYGQKITSYEFNFNGADAVKSVSLNRTLPAGAYSAVIILPGGNNTTLKIVAQ